MTLIWQRLTVREKETLEGIIKKAKSIQQKYSKLAELQQEREKYITELKAICRKCTDEDCAVNINCEVKKAYLMLFGRQ